MGWDRSFIGLFLGIGLTVEIVLAETPALAVDDSITFEQKAREQYMDGLYGAADESIRAAIENGHPEDYNRFILFQGLIASRMAADGQNAADGRAIIGMAVEHSPDGAWPRPVIDYLLGDKKLQAVANAIAGSGISNEAKMARLCELSFYAGAFAGNDGERIFAARLLDKADETCSEDSPYRLLTALERERLEIPAP